jgi:FK506-binding protein 4/5
MSDSEDAHSNVSEAPVESEVDEAIKALDENASEFTLEQGAIVKKILRKGEGRRPPNNAEVRVHYVGRLLDGTEFDSSRKRNEPFKFRLGAGNVIKGWDKGVATMRVGELCELTIKPEFAYGSAGSPPNIPPDATLVFEIELLEVNTKQKVGESGQVFKDILKKGEGYSRPNESATVTVRYVGRLEDGTVFDSAHEHKETTFVLSEDLERPLGLEEGIRSMLKGETSKIMVKPAYGFRSEGHAEMKVPPNANLVYEVTLVDFTKGKESWDMSFEEKLQYMRHRKEQGTALFKRNRVEEARLRYDAGLKIVRYDGDLSAEQKKDLNELKVAVTNNLAACHAKLKNFDEVLRLSNEALQIDANNVKALFRRAQVRGSRGEDEEARADLEKALQFDSNNAEIQRALREVKQRLAAERERARRLFAGMFDKVTLTSEDEAKRQAAAAAKKKKKKQQPPKENASADGNAPAPAADAEKAPAPAADAEKAPAPAADAEKAPAPAPAPAADAETEV